MERYSDVKQLLRWCEEYLNDRLCGDRLVLFVEDKPNRKFPAYHNLSIIVYRVKSRTEKDVICRSNGSYRTDEERDAIVDKLAVCLLREMVNYGIQ